MKTKLTIALIKSALSRTIATLMVILVLSVTICKMMDILLPAQINSLYNYASIGMIALVTCTILYKVIQALALTLQSRFSSLS